MKDMREIEATVKEIRELKAMKEELENQLKSLENEIINFMSETETTELIGGNFKATYKEQSRVTLDKNKLSEILGEDLKPFEKVSIFSVLRIK